MRAPSYTPRVAPRLPTPSDVLAAHERLRGIALDTPLEPAPALAAASGAAEVRLKLEALQPTGSFKIRGAHNKLALLAAARAAGEVPDLPVITASSGNHGIAVAHAAARYGMTVTILVGHDVSPAKLEWLRSLETDTITVELEGRDYDEAEAEARRREQLGAATYAAPYNDADVIAGQGTIGLEIMEAWPECDAMLVPIGGGGLIAGIGLWAKAIKPELRLVGVQPAASPPMYVYLQTGSTKPVPIAPTLADGVSGNIERGSMTWGLSRKLVDSVLLVEEEEIIEAMRWAIDEQRLLLEASAVLGVASLLHRGSSDLEGTRVAVICTGRNVDGQAIRRVLSTS
ncbi:MAG: pyridoxal-phosphate dependent enzyme [Chloroflexi bacterium]|nr:MAG: pyridoxal-phosphate dependent enzyme [Chloroflexota bacterium]